MNRFAMNRTTLLTLLVLPACPVWAQPAGAPRPPAPPPPFVAEAPDNCSWKIKHETGKKADEPPAVGNGAGPMMVPGAAGQTAQLEEIRVAKAGKTRRVVRKWSDGQSREAWYLGSLCLGELPGQDGKLEVMVIDLSADPGMVDTRPMTLGALSGADYSKGDFPELAWIRADHFAGTETRESAACHVYRLTAAETPPPSRREDFTMPENLRPGKSPRREEPAAAGGSPPGPRRTVVTMEAKIDRATKLPLSFHDVTTRRTYSFSMETPQIALPARFQQALDEYQADLEAAKHRRMP